MERRGIKWLQKHLEDYQRLSRLSRALSKEKIEQGDKEKADEFARHAKEFSRLAKQVRRTIKERQLRAEEKDTKVRRGTKRKK